jgi:hypothetical protein
MRAVIAQINSTPSGVCLPLAGSGMVFISMPTVGGGDMDLTCSILRSISTC